MVSEADLAVEQLIKSRLAEAYPEDAFLGEESGYTEVAQSTGIWVVDPIDGTQPFVSGLRTWCISIAYVRDGEVVFGLVNNAAADELFAGGVGEPATRNGQVISGHPGQTLGDGLTFLGCSARIWDSSLPCSAAGDRTGAAARLRSWCLKPCSPSPQTGTESTPSTRPRGDP